MTKLYSVVLLMFLATTGALHAQTNVTSVDQTYSQNFNTLANSGTTNAFGLSNWTSNKETYNGNDGALGTGAIYSYGAAGTTERALGSLNSGSNPKLYFGTSFKNESGASIGKISVTYTGEQWRNGTKNVLGAGTLLPDSLVFQYSLNATGAADSNATWTSVGALTFITPTIAATESKLDGNASANKATLSAELGISLAAGQTLVIRWANERSTSSSVVGSRHGLAIDDLTVTFGEGGEVPVDPCDFDLDAIPTITYLESDPSSFYVEFDKVEGAKSYLVLLDQVVSEDHEFGVPIDGNTYSVGNFIFDSKVVGLITDDHFELTDLEADNYFYVTIVPVFECDGNTLYGTEDYFDFLTIEICDDPSSIGTKFINLTPGATSVSFQAMEVRDAVGYIILMDENIDEEYSFGYPEDNTEYEAGDYIEDSKVVYVGTDLGGTIEGLNPDSEYIFTIIPIFECEDDILYGYYYEQTIQTLLPTLVRKNDVKNILIYPNPVSGNVLNVRLDAATQGKANVQIFNVLGAQVYGAQQSISSNTQLRLPNVLPAGRYTLRIEQNGAAQIGSFIVVK